MLILRTPDDRFDGLEDYAFRPRYRDIAAEGVTLRMHAVHEGPDDVAPVLLMHGEPSWAYLYRHMISGLAARGRLVIAPDLVGFGRSDKPAEQTGYTYERHVQWMSTWLLAEDLRDITLFCQDWGGLIGLRLVAAFPDRFARVVVANTGLPEGTGWSEGFKRWLGYSQSVPSLPIGSIIKGAVERPLTAGEIAAYDAPFPDESYKAGARCFPTLVPITPEHASVAENKAAWAVLEQFDRPFLTAFSDSDPVTKGGELAFQDRIPGARGQPHRIVAAAGHFLQEDKPQELVDLLDGWIAATAP
jgi:haloalkane dehalogenase